MTHKRNAFTLIELLVVIAIAVVVHISWDLLFEDMFKEELRRDWEYFTAEKGNCGVLEKDLRDASDHVYEVIVVKSCANTNQIVFRRRDKSVLPWGGIGPTVSNRYLFAGILPDAETLMLPAGEELVLVYPRRERDIDDREGRVRLLHECVHRGIVIVARVNPVVGFR